MMQDADAASKSSYWQAGDQISMEKKVIISQIPDLGQV